MTSWVYFILKFKYDLILHNTSLSDDYIYFYWSKFYYYSYTSKMVKYLEFLKTGKITFLNISQVP